MATANALYVRRAGIRRRPTGGSREMLAGDGGALDHGEERRSDDG
jgi:hypothetical protein